LLDMAYGLWPAFCALCSANIHAAFGRKPVWCKKPNEPYDIVIEQYYG
jgi:hypothetical protein